MLWLGEQVDLFVQVEWRRFGESSEVVICDWVSGPDISKVVADEGH